MREGEKHELVFTVFVFGAFLRTLSCNQHRYPKSAYIRISKCLESQGRFSDAYSAAAEARDLEPFGRAVRLLCPRLMALHSKDAGYQASDTIAETRAFDVLPTTYTVPYDFRRWSYLLGLFLEGPPF